ncbi:MAG: histidinol-phosphatase [Actinobacteria bacterium]|nr:MAG: histidinol-phosphatase [Actinomycetota bacterium]
MPYEQELAAMQGWLDATDKIALDHFRVDVPYKNKDDGTPVTEADVAIEHVLRKAIEETYPEDAVVGEEGGTGGEAKSERRWIIDPIDGTKNFRRGIPIFATLIALEDDGRVVAGVASASGIGTRWFARKGGGAFRDSDHRGFGDFWGHVLVAQGSMDVMLDPEVNLWDLAAVKIIVDEAGGKMTTVSGENRLDGGSALTTNGALHEEVLRALNG